MGKRFVVEDSFWQVFPDVEIGVLCVDGIKPTDQYIADAPQWGYIDAERWNGFYKWLYDNKLIDKDLTDIGFTNDYLPEE